MKSLAVKYRPTTFDDVVEQGPIKVILQQQLKTNTTKNAYLFCGGAGTGKTTCARIFANEINHNQGNPIEMDAASNSSVDDVRDIIQQAKTKSLDSEYKVFIIDECFPASTKVSTPGGALHISDVLPGDYVYSMTGIKRVTHNFSNRVLTNRLCCVIIGDRKIVTTAEHLFFTDMGWVRACDLKKGDVVYAQDVSKSMSTMRQGVSSAEQPRRSDILLQQLCDEAPICNNADGSQTEGCERDQSLPSMWKTIYGPCDGQSEDLLKEVRNTTRCEVVYSMDEYRMWDGKTETIIRKNVDAQSDARSTHRRQDVGYKGTEWNTTSVADNQGWEWEVHDFTDTLVASIRRWLGIGVPNQHEKSELARTSTTLVLQSRPWLFSEETGSRGRWSRPQVEKQFITGCKENELFTEARVDCSEVYKRGYNDELFLGSFTGEELSGDYVTMYDLEVEDDHAYCADGILVHNCHSISNTGWQAFLKLIEEPPAKSVFIFCTTDPQKIPKTILSRVQRYDFQRISHNSVVQRLHEICVAEEVAPTPAGTYDEALDFIAKLADGGMRDAITLLDKCLSYNRDLSIENVVKALGAVDYDTMFFLTDSIITNELDSIIKTIENIHRSGKDLKQFVKTYTVFILDLCKYGSLKSFEYLEIPSIYKKKMDTYNEHSYNDHFPSLLNTLVKLNADIKWETSPKALIEATLILEGDK